VSHPGIAQVYDYGEDGAAASPYLVMGTGRRAIPGACAGGRAAHPGDAMDVLAQAAAGLQAAHAAGLVTPGRQTREPCCVGRPAR
jgi:serine/threonine-protein kinase